MRLCWCHGARRAWEAGVPNPHIGSQWSKIRGCGPGCVPNAGLPTIQLDAGAGGQLMGRDIVDCAGTAGHDYSINVIQENQ